MDKQKVLKTDLDGLFQALSSSKAGLNDAEAMHRQQIYGKNTLKTTKRRSAFGLLFKQFKSSLIYLLLIACVLSFALKEVNDGLIIAFILALNTGLSFYQAYKSEKAVEVLQKLVSKEVLVVRGSTHVLVADETLVPGDVVVLREGDIVPADIRLFDVNDFKVNESQLTGESLPVTKSLSGGDGSLAYAGSIVESGEGSGIIYAISSSTELGKIAHLSSTTKRTTQFEASLTSFSNFLVKVTGVSLLMIFILKLILVRDLSQTGNLAIFMIALAIAVVPETMPVIVTITLSRGALNLAKHHVIAKTLTAVEDLGNINVLCSDKTGTLTENKLSIKNLTAEDKDLFLLLSAASLESLDEKRKKFQSSFDRAFLEYIPEAILDSSKQFIRLEELPFDPRARRRRVVAKRGDKTYLIVVGSVETLLSLTHEPKHSDYMRVIREDGLIGLRHLGIAYKEIVVKGKIKYDILKHENGLHFAGFVTMEDPLRSTAKHALILAEKLGVKIKILSGDSREVTHYVASEVGLVGKNQMVYTGQEIDAMSDMKLSEVVKQNNAFARLTPEQKYRIIKLLKLHGNVVGYQGDGINDAPSLKLADVAIAVSNASDVAQENSDILLLRNDLGVIVNGIMFGRGIFSNINKFIRYTMISNFGVFFSLGALYLLKASLPLLTIQLLFSNLMTSLPLIAISTDNVDSEEVAKPSLYSTKALYFISIFLGMYTAMFYLVFFAVDGRQSIVLTRTSFYLFMTITSLVIIFSVRNKEHFWRAPALSKTLKLALSLVAVITIGAVYVAGTQHLFSFRALSIRSIGLILIMTLMYFIFLDTTKVWFYKTNFGSDT